MLKRAEEEACRLKVHAKARAVLRWRRRRRPWARWPLEEYRNQCLLRDEAEIESQFDLIVFGKRKRKQTDFFVQKVYASQKYKSIALEVVPEDERFAAMEDVSEDTFDY